MVQINFVPRRIAAFNRTNHVKAGGSPGLLAMLAVGSPRSCRDKRWIARGLSAGLRDHRPHHNLQWHLQKSSDRILNLVSLASVPSRNCCFFQSSTWSVVCLIVWRIGARAATYQIARDRENSSNESRRKCIGEQERSTGEARRWMLQRWCHNGWIQISDSFLPHCHCFIFDRGMFLLSTIRWTVAAIIVAVLPGQFGLVFRVHCAWSNYVLSVAN
jgi:hypothetical protein